MLVGQVIPVKEGLNYQIRIGVIMQFLEQSRQIGMEISPQGVQAITTRMDGLLQAMEQVDTNNARALGKEVREYLQNTGMIPSTEEVEQAQINEAMAMSAPQPQA